MCSRLLDPPAHRAGLEAPGGDDRLDGTAMHNQGDDQRNQRRVGGLPKEGSPAPRTEGVPANRARVKLFAAVVNGNVALLGLTPCRTGRIRAELLVRIHRASPGWQTQEILRGSALLF